MADLPRYIVDASVASKWHLGDEAFRPLALAVQEDFQEGRSDLLAPDQFRHEVAAAILKATRNSQREERLDPGIARRALEVFLALDIDYVPTARLIPAAVAIARAYSTSYYDSLYLALAQTTNTPFLHADNKLRNALRDRFPLALWIEDYTPK